MAYKIVVASQKGGVAKTTTAVNLADGLMYMNYRVLLIDLDPQCNSTSVFIGNDATDENSASDFILERKKISECISHTDFGDIVCGSKDLASWEGQLLTVPGGTKRVKKALREIEELYDYIIMDTPPNVGAFMRSALFAANGIVTPLQAKRFALDGLSDFIDTVEELRYDGNENLEILGILLTMYDKRNRQDREVIEALPEVADSLNIHVFSTPIRICQDIENSISASKSLFRTKSSSNGANDYADFIGELLDMIGGSR